MRNGPSPFTAEWQEAVPESILLMEGEVHLWAWKLTASPEQQELLFGLLSEDERLRLSRFHFPADRLAYLVARGTLRRILGSCLSLPPAEIHFTYNGYGRPAIAPREHPARLPNLEFNLSHTRMLAVAAVTRTLRLGVDIESVRPIESSVAQRIFSLAEQETLLSLSPAQYLASFYRCWTRKEAICKAEGLGHNMDLSSFSVSLRPTDLPCVLDSGGFLTRRWHLQDVPAIDGVIGALATSELPDRVRHFRLRTSNPNKREIGPFAASTE